MKRREEAACLLETIALFVTMLEVVVKAATIIFVLFIRVKLVFAVVFDVIMTIACADSNIVAIDDTGYIACVDETVEIFFQILRIFLFFGIFQDVLGFLHEAYIGGRKIIV